MSGAAPNARDAFDTMGVEPRFDVDDRELERRHRELSRALHPDRYAGKPAAERRMALGKAIEVNDAFRVLCDPIRRAEALARRSGLAVGETTEPKPPPDLLMEMMEAREELSDAHRNKDLTRVTAMGKAMQSRQAETIDRLRRAFAETDHDRVLPLLGELRYIRRFLEEVEAFEEHLETEG